MKRPDSRAARRRWARAPSAFDSDSASYASHGRAAHKAAQLCRQAMQALSLELAGSADDLLRELVIVTVAPAPDASRLLVTVALSPSARPQDFSPVDLLARLNASAPRLRRAVAQFITRKRAPELLFALDGPPEVRP